MEALDTYFNQVTKVLEKADLLRESTKLSFLSKFHL